MSDVSEVGSTEGAEGSRRWFGKALLLGAPIAAAGVLADGQAASANTGDPWVAGGNAADPADTLGTTNSSSLLIVTSGVERMRVDGVEGNVGIGTSTPAAKAQLHVKNFPATRPFTARFDNVATNGVSLLCNATGPNGRGVTGNASGTGGSAIAGYGLAPGTAVNGVYGETQSDNGVGVKGIASGNNATGVYGESTANGVGIRGKSVNANAIHGSSSGGGIGVLGSSGGGYGVLGDSATSIGVRGQSDSSAGVEGRSVHGTGVFGESGGGGPGVHGISIGGAGVAASSTSGFGVFATSVDLAGVFGGSTNGESVRGGSTNGVGTIGFSATSTGVLGQSSSGWGVYGVSDTNVGVNGVSSSAAGVLGTSTSGYGVRGESPSLVGVVGVSTSGTGVSGKTTSGVGVYGESNNIGVSGVGRGFGVVGNCGVDSATVGYAVYGVASSNNYSGYFGGGKGVFVNGNTTVLGTLAKTAGTFKIDHPQDPANRYLVHSFVESPEMKNVYDGVIVCDANGEAVVELPSYFEALNRTFRYQLTCIGAHAPVYVANEIADGRFRIAGGTSGLKVSWQVTGVRQDAYAEANPIVVEPEKVGDERGTYLHPELFGADVSRRFGAPAAHAGSAVLQVRA
jgi:hypothetical protein